MNIVESQMKELTPIEEAIVTSARDDGTIPFPQGSVRVVEKTFRTLESLARRGYVQYVSKTWYRAYWITEKGRRIAGALGVGRRKKSTRTHYQTRGFAFRHNRLLNCHT